MSVLAGSAHGEEIDSGNSSRYWRTVLDGFRETDVERQVREWSFEPVPPLRTSTRRVGLESSLYPERRITEGQLKSNDPCEDDKISFDVPSIRATCHCVVDGHGGVGTKDRVIEWFPNLLVRRIEHFSKDRGLDEHDIAACLRGALIELEAMIMVESMSNKYVRHSGACFACAIVLDKVVIAANIGDCGVFLVDSCGDMFSLQKITYDHTPLRHDEAMRVKSDMALVDKCPIRPSFP